MFCVRYAKYFACAGRALLPSGTIRSLSSYPGTGLASKQLSLEEKKLDPLLPEYASIPVTKKNKKEDCAVSFSQHAITLSVPSQNLIRTQFPVHSPRNNGIPFHIPTNPVPSVLPGVKLVDEIYDGISQLNIEAPSHHIEEKKAARLIVIRRRKMKKHKLKKLRKRMKFEWEKVRQKRELKKEKAFRAELMAQIKEAEKFDAEQYVTEMLRKSKEKPIPRYWKGRRLPEEIIKQKLGLE